MKQKNLKILYVSHALEEAGGAEISLKTLANQFKQNNHEVIYAALGKYSEFKTYIFKKFHPIYSYELYEKYLSRFIGGVIKREHPDIIHANDRFTIIPSIIAAKKERLPIVIHFRDFSLLTTTGLPYSTKSGFLKSFGFKEIFKIVPKKRILWELYKYFYIKRRYKIINQADFKICISRAIQEWVEKQGIKNSMVVNNPIEPEIPKKMDSQKKIRKEFGIPNNATVILFLSGFSVGKGIDIVIKILKKINSFKEKPYFLLIGRGAEEKTIRELSKREKYIIYPGRLPHNQIYKAYKAADIVLLPSKIEPFSRIVIEAMSMEKAVICSNTGGGKEVIVNGESGLLVDPENLEEWINAINSLIENKRLFNKFKLKYKNIAKKFSRSEAYKNVLKIYLNHIKINRDNRDSRKEMFKKQKSF